MSQRYEAIQGAAGLPRQQAATVGRPRSKTRQVIEDIAGQIEVGVLKAGDRLPSAAQLCRQYGVSTAVVGRATLWLKAVGLVVGVPGVGVFVAHRRATR